MLANTSQLVRVSSLMALVMLIENVLCCSVYLLKTSLLLLMVMQLSLLLILMNTKFKKDVMISFVLGFCVILMILFLEVLFTSKLLEKYGLILKRGLVMRL